MRRQMIARRRDAAAACDDFHYADQQPLTAIFIDIIIRECFSAVRARVNIQAPQHGTLSMSLKRQ